MDDPKAMFKSGIEICIYRKLSDGKFINNSSIKQPF